MKDNFIVKRDKKIFIVYVAFILCVSTLYLSWTRNYFFNNSKELLSNLLTQEAEYYDNHLDKQLLQINLWLEYVKRSNQIKPLTSESFIDYLQIFEYNRNFDSVFYIHNDGTSLSPQKNGLTKFEGTLFSSILNNKDFGVDIYYNENTEDFKIIYAVPMISSDGLEGVLCAKQTMSTFNKSIRNIYSNNQINLFLIDSENNIIASNDHILLKSYGIYENKGTISSDTFFDYIDDARSIRQCKTNMNQNNKIFETKVHGKSSLIGFAELKNTEGWRLALCINKGEAIATSNIIFLVGIGFIIITSLLQYLLFINMFAYIEKQHIEMETVEVRKIFISKLSHEIRTPVTAISGLSNILLEQFNSTSSEQQDLIKDIQLSSTYLVDLINNALEYNKAQSNTLAYNATTFSLTEVFNEINHRLSYHVTKKHTNHIFDNQLTVDYVIGDVYKLKIILINILGNAIKFTGENGTVTLCCSQDIDSNNKLFIRFSVIDEGIGIANSDIDKIFLPFKQANEKISSTYGGTGLGLPLTKEYCEFLGGSISVESVIDQGSTFTVLLPFTATSKPTEEIINTVNETTSSLSLLIAEDDLINQRILNNILSKYDFSTTFVNNGQECIDCFLSHPENSFHIILMDIHMPLVNGYEATLAIRKSKRPDAMTIPIVALTANMFDNTEDVTMKHQMNGILYKP